MCIIAHVQHAHPATIAPMITPCQSDAEEVTIVLQERHHAQNVQLVLPVLMVNNHPLLVTQAITLMMVLSKS